MNRRGFLVGLLAAPVVLRFAGALSPKPIADSILYDPAMTPLEKLTVRMKNEYHCSWVSTEGTVYNFDGSESPSVIWYSAENSNS